MAGVTEASAPQSVWLEQLAEFDMDWDSISLPSTPKCPKLDTAALSPSTEDVASLPHGFANAASHPALLSPTDDDFFCDTPDFETFLRETEGIDFSSTTLASTSSFASTPAALNVRPGSSSSDTSVVQTSKRIIRGTFPPALTSNSPIPGLTSSICLRTLFCLGEALNVGCQAARNDEDVLLEFYCRVISSYREDNTQHFVLADLTHDNPPFIKATFAS
ncbi:unnamed protein product [Aureobasidium uvarum]|uniref:Uncharacterized protein n=1 Tax=Aureobasidium uvarum TaxID=2773716 RepID=A0A9N8KN08_9PEZI|nr:unnamed protein product [Aureobasidium uvarum]